MSNYEELRKMEMEIFDGATKKMHEALIKYVEAYGAAFYRIYDVYNLKNEELKQKIILEAIEHVLK